MKWKQSLLGSVSILTGLIGFFGVIGILSLGLTGNEMQPLDPWGWAVIVDLFIIISSFYICYDIIKNTRKNNLYYKTAKILLAITIIGTIFGLVDRLIFNYQLINNTILLIFISIIVLLDSITRFVIARHYFKKSQKYSLKSLKKTSFWTLGIAGILLLLIVVVLVIDITSTPSEQVTEEYEGPNLQIFKVTIKALNLGFTISLLLGILGIAGTYLYEVSYFLAKKYIQ